jgi:hypothetical protein
VKYQLITFEKAIEISSIESKRHLLLGNGFSIACRQNIFRYDSLFEQADFSALSPNIQKVFELLKTKDFEVVMKLLKASSAVLKLYSSGSKEISKSLSKDAEDLKRILVNAIASSHPESPSDITNLEYSNCKSFLSNFNHYYTLNYDLLLYWACMHVEEDEKPLSDDGFRTPDSGHTDYVSWDIEKTDAQNLFYLHGALHVFDAGAELKKYTWKNTGIRLIDQIRDALDHNLFPLFVSEGTHLEKIEKIIHSSYLSRGMRSFSHIGGALFIHGHSLARNDSHILNLIPKSKIKKLFVSIHGDIESSINKNIIKEAELIISKRKSKLSLELHFYDSNSAKIWR